MKERFSRVHAKRIMIVTIDYVMIIMTHDNHNINCAHWPSGRQCAIKE